MTCDGVKGSFGLLAKVVRAGRGQKPGARWGTKEYKTSSPTGAAVTRKPVRKSLFIIKFIYS